MIERIYINNFRCFQNFDLSLKDKSSALIIGKNGVGKSTLAKALKLFQSIARGDNRLRQLISKSDFFNHNLGAPIRFEIDVKLDDELYEYKLSLEWPDKFKECKILNESLVVAGAEVFRREEAQVIIPSTSTEFAIDWHNVGLPFIQLRETENPIAKLKKWLSTMVLISPIPQLITGHSEDDSFELDWDASNFADWFSALIRRYPASYSVVESFLREVMADFLDFDNSPAGEYSSNLFIRFSPDQSKKSLRLDFKELSDGEKCFFICATLLAANKYYGPLFCLWDEPDNYLALAEVGHLVLGLRKEFGAQGQIIVTSHNPESIRKFADENTLLLSRKSHKEPTNLRWLEQVDYKGDLIDLLIQGDLSDGSE